MTSNYLHVLIDGILTGKVYQEKTGKLSFEYDQAYQDGSEQIPLSLSMPLALQRHPDKVIAPWMWNLLPDNEFTLERWGQRYECSPRNAFALLGAVGEDCAGAVQFLTEEKLSSPSEVDGITWIDGDEIGRRLAELRGDVAAGRRRSDHGQFSLAGAQAKTAYYRDPANPDRWGIPEGRVPTTHIFKPPIPDLNGHVENEHFCLRLAQNVGMHAAQSSVMKFSGEKVIVVERYDRITQDDIVYRLHQEDMCQALKVHPTKKYEKDGGPGIEAIMTKVLTQSSEPDVDRQRFMEAVIFNFLIGGTDAHAKNYSMLLDVDGSAALAPLYDIASILPHLGEGHVDAEMRNIRLAMRISKKYVIDEIMPRHWKGMSEGSGFSGDATLALLRHQIAIMPDCLVSTANECREEGITHPVIDRIVDLVGGRLKKLQSIYGAELLTENSWSENHENNRDTEVIPSP